MHTQHRSMPSEGTAWEVCTNCRWPDLMAAALLTSRATSLNAELPVSSEVSSVGCTHSVTMRGSFAHCCHAAALHALLCLLIKTPWPASQVRPGPLLLTLEADILLALQQHPRTRLLEGRGLAARQAVPGPARPWALGGLTCRLGAPGGPACLHTQG